MATPPIISRGDIYHFEGIPGATVKPDLGLTSFEAGGYVQVKDISFAGELRVTRGIRKPNGDFRFNRERTKVSLADAHAMIANRVWRLHNF